MFDFILNIKLDFLNCFGMWKKFWFVKITEFSQHNELYLKIPSTIWFLMTWPIKHRNEAVFHIIYNFNLSHPLVFLDSSFCYMSMFLGFIHSLVDLFLQTLGFKMTRLITSALCIRSIQACLLETARCRKRERERKGRKKHKKKRWEHNEEDMPARG